MKSRRVAVLLAWALGVISAHGVEVVFEGNTLFSNDRLIRALARYDVKVDGDVTTSDDAAFFLREFYFQQGFPDAGVTYDFTPDRTVFHIDEGARLWIGRISFDGGEALPAERLEAVFTATIRQSTHSPFGRLRFVQNAIEDAVAQVRSTFVSEGFLDAEAGFETSEGLLPKTTNIRVWIREGTFYRVTAVRIDGPSIPEAGDLQTHLQTFVNRPFRSGDEILCRSRATDFLRSRGYYFASATVAPEKTESGSVTLVVTIKPGRQMVIGKVTAAGMLRTREAALLRRFGIRSGKTYDATALDTAERRLWFSGAFSNVNVRTTPLEDGSVNVDLKVEEGQARHVSGTVGYSEWDRAFATATFVDRNVFGTLNRFSLEGFISQRSYGGQATLADPWLFGQDITGTAALFAFRRELPAYRATQFGTTLGIEARRNDRTLTGWRLDYQWRVVTDADVYSGSSENTLENYQLGMLSFRQQLDTRNDVLAPMRGYNLKYDVGIASPALLGELSFFKLSAQATYFLPLRKILPERPFVPFLIFNHRAGVIVPFAGTDSVPVPERFFLGGPDSVRSFQLDGMAPRDSDGVPTGGLAFFQANIELQYPIWQGIFAAVFTDFGNLSSRLDDLTWGETRVAPGAGIRFYTPLGALRVDYGYNLIRKSGDPIGNWQFGLGFTF